jgi:hypothetical protein
MMLKLDVGLMHRLEELGARNNDSRRSTVLAGELFWLPLGLLLSPSLLELIRKELRLPAVAVR